MKPIVLIVIGAVLLVMFAGQNNPRPNPGPRPPRPPRDAPNFVPVFQEGVQTGHVDRETAREHAKRLGDLAYEAGDLLEFDGQQQPPQIDTARKFIATRAMMRHFRERGGSYAAVYPSLGPTIEEYLDRKVGRDDQDGVDENTMTPERRRQYIEAYREGLYPAFLQASQEL